MKLISKILQPFCMDAKSIKFISSEAVSVEIASNTKNLPRYSAQDYAKLSGALAGSKLVVDFHEDMVQMLLINDEILKDPVSTYLFYKNGRPELVKTHKTAVIDGLQGNGITTRMFYIHAKTAQKLGFKVLEGDGLIVKAGDGNEAHNGAYTFSRLGFDAQFDEENIAALPMGFKDCESLHQLLSRPGGQGVWKDNATSIHMTFDLHSESESWSTLNNYIKEKKVRLWNEIR